jgi:RNA polymerase sigma-70 factor (ECF subfamily)
VTPPAIRTQQDEQALVERIQTGEKELFYELIRPHQRSVYVTALAILQNEADAEEVAQDTFLKALTHLGQFRWQAKFSTWLIQIAVNEARMRRRKSHPEVMRPLEEHADEEGYYTPREFADWREIPSETLERKEVRNALASALASLAQAYREVFVLRDVHELSIEETAEALSISQGAVKSRLLRARLMLRDLLAPGLDGRWTTRLSFQKGSKPWA